MSLIKRNPTTELDVWNRDFPMVRGLHSFQHEMNRMLDQFFRNDVFDESVGTAVFTPAIDFSETKEAYVVKAELPGIKKDDVKVTLNNNILTITGEKKSEYEKKEGNYHRIERSFGMFERSITIPGAIKSDAIDAKYADGLLTLTLPKTEETKQKTIDVKVK